MIAWQAPAGPSLIRAPPKTPLNGYADRQGAGSLSPGPRYSIVTAPPTKNINASPQTFVAQKPTQRAVERWTLQESVPRWSCGPAHVGPLVENPNALHALASQQLGLFLSIICQQRGLLFETATSFAFLTRPLLLLLSHPSLVVARVLLLHTLSRPCKAHSSVPTDSPCERCRCFLIAHPSSPKHLTTHTPTITNNGRTKDNHRDKPQLRVRLPAILRAREGSRRHWRAKAKPRPRRRDPRLRPR